LGVGQLLQELDYPSAVMAMANRPSPTAKDFDCPLNLCNHVKAIVLVPNRPRLFVACLRKRQFCGLCPRGTILESNENSFRCIPTLDQSTNETNDCDSEKVCQSTFSPKLFLSMVNESEIGNFIICSKKRSFCGFCPTRIATFNQTTLTCDLTFPEIKFLCPDRSSMQVYPDPLTPCSSLAYVCLPGKRRGIVLRCPDPTLRHNQRKMTCDLPEHVPECGGIIQPSSNQTGSELELPFNATQLGRGGEATANCVANCMYQYYKPKNYCIRFCTY